MDLRGPRRVGFEGKEEKGLFRVMCHYTMQGSSRVTLLQSYMYPRVSLYLVYFFFFYFHFFISISPFLFAFEVGAYSKKTLDWLHERSHMQTKKEAFIKWPQH